MTKTIPLWKWFLLYFVKTYAGFDEKDGFATICFMKKLFGELYIWKIEYYIDDVLVEVRKLKRS